MVVVFPAPFGPKQTEALADLYFQIQPADSFDLAVVSFPQVTTLNRRSHPEILPESRQCRRECPRSCSSATDAIVLR